jgi:uncharacterized protein YeaC (DUF1315 family)
MLYDDIETFSTAVENGSCLPNSRFKSSDVADLRRLVVILIGGKCPQGLQLELSNIDHVPQSLEHLVTALQSGNCPEGLVLSLSGDNLGPEDAQHLTAALQSGNCPRGLQLLLNGNNLGPQGVQHLATALQSGNCPQELQLNLSANNLGPQGAQHLATALQSGNCPQGLQLDLSWNYLGPQGTQPLATALQSGKCPQGLQLDLSNTYLDPQSIQHLATALQSGNCPQGLKLITGDDRVAALLAKKTRETIVQIEQLSNAVDIDSTSCNQEHDTNPQPIDLNSLFDLVTNNLKILTQVFPPEESQQYLQELQELYARLSQLYAKLVHQHILASLPINPTESTAKLPENCYERLDKALGLCAAWQEHVIDLHESGMDLKKILADKLVELAGAFINPDESAALKNLGAPNTATIPLAEYNKIISHLATKVMLYNQAEVAAEKSYGEKENFMKNLLLALDKKPDTYMEREKITDIAKHPCFEIAQRLINRAYVDVFCGEDNFSNLNKISECLTRGKNPTVMMFTRNGARSQFKFFTPFAKNSTRDDASYVEIVETPNLGVSLRPFTPNYL